MQRDGSRGPFREGQGVVHCTGAEQKVGFAFSSFGAFEEWMKRQFMRIKDNYQPSLLWDDDTVLLVNFDQSSIEYVPKSSVSTLQEFSLQHSAQEFERVLNPLLENGKVVVNSRKPAIRHARAVTQETSHSSDRSSDRSSEPSSEPSSEANSEANSDQSAENALDDSATPRDYVVSGLSHAHWSFIKQTLKNDDLTEEAKANRIMPIFTHDCSWKYMDKSGYFIAPPHARHVKLTMEDILPILRDELNLPHPEGGRRRQAPSQKMESTKVAKEKRSVSKTPAVTDKRKAQMKVSANKKPAPAPVAVQRHTRRKEDPDELTSDELDVFTQCWKILKTRGWSCQYQYVGPTRIQEEFFVVPEVGGAKMDALQQGLHYHSKKELVAVASTYPWLWQQSWEEIWNMLTKNGWKFTEDNQFVVKDTRPNKHVLGLNTFASPNHVLAFISRYPYLATFDKETATLLFGKDEPSTAGLLGPKFVEAHRPLFQYPKYSSHACIGGRDASLAVSAPLRPSVDHDFDLDKVARLVAERRTNIEDEDELRMLLLQYCGWTVVDRDGQRLYLTTKTTVEAVESEQATVAQDYFCGWDQLHDALVERIGSMGFDLNDLWRDHIPCTQGTPGDDFNIAERAGSSSDDDGAPVGLADLYKGRAAKHHSSDEESDSGSSDLRVDLRAEATEILATELLYEDCIRRVLAVYDRCDNSDDREAIFHKLFAYLKTHGWVCVWDRSSELADGAYQNPEGDKFTKPRHVINHLKNELGIPLRTPDKISTAEKPRRARLQHQQPRQQQQQPRQQQRATVAKRKEEAPRSPVHHRASASVAIEELEEDSDEVQEEEEEMEEASEEDFANPKALAADVVNADPRVPYEDGVRRLLAIYDNTPLDDKRAVFQMLLSFLEFYDWTWNYLKDGPSDIVYITPGAQKMQHGVDVFYKEREVVKYLKEQLGVPLRTPDIASVSKRRRIRRGDDHPVEVARPSQRSPVKTNKRPLSAAEENHERKRVPDESTRFQTPQFRSSAASVSSGFPFTSHNSSRTDEHSEASPLDDGYEQLFNWKLDGKPFDPTSSDDLPQERVEAWLERDGWRLEEDATGSVVYLKPNADPSVTGDPSLEGVQYFCGFQAVWDYIVKKFERRAGIARRIELELPQHSADAEPSTPSPAPMEMPEADEAEGFDVSGKTLREVIEAAQAALVLEPGAHEKPVGREGEYDTVMEFLHALLKAKTGGALCLYGHSGTGKTLVATACLHRIQQEYDGLDVVVVNAQTCKPLASRLADKLGVRYEEGDDNDARTKLFATLVPRRSKTGDTRSAITTIICVDEIDRAPQELARQLLEGASAPCSQYVVIGIANTQQALEGAPSVGFEAYKADKLAEILKVRTYGLFTTSALRLVTLQTALAGDCRKALDMAAAALGVAARNASGLDQPFNPEKPIVENAHVVQVKKVSGNGIHKRQEALKSFDPHVRLLLVAAVTGFSDLSRAYTLQQIYEQYTTLCSILGTSNPPLSDDTLHDALHNLSDYNFVTAVASFGRPGKRGADGYRFAITAEELLPHVEPVLARHLEAAIARKQSERS